MVHFSSPVSSRLIWPPVAAAGLRIHPCSRAFALWELPKCTRAATLLIVNVVSFLNASMAAHWIGSARTATGATCGWGTYGLLSPNPER